MKPFFKMVSVSKLKFFDISSQKVHAFPFFTINNKNRIDIGNKDLRIQFAIM